MNPGEKASFSQLVIVGLKTCPFIEFLITQIESQKLESCKSHLSDLGFPIVVYLI